VLRLAHDLADTERILRQADAVLAEIAELDALAARQLVLRVNDDLQRL
jgi:hypothetical protein